MSDKKMGYKSLPIGDILEAGTSEDFETGSWRSKCPILDSKKCINCLVCWVYCPDSAIKVEEGKIKTIELKHCKGCGICAKVCPPKVQAITMVDEQERKK